MFNIIKVSKYGNVLNAVKNSFSTLQTRSFLSQAYYCQEVWDHRLSSNVLRRVKPDELFYELDQRYQKTGQISAIDVDIFVNAIKDETYVDELLDLIHKLRLSADTTNKLHSTPHAVIRYLLQSEKHQDLLHILDDRLNYGLFLDYYTANILMDTYWKSKDFTSGARIASQLMLQEEIEHPVSNSLSILHCYNYLLNPINWPVPTPPVEPEDEVKVRVKYLRNPYDDEHFDLRDPNRIVGKTIALCTETRTDPLGMSFNIIGWTLFGNSDRITKILKSCKDKNIILIKEIIDLMPDSASKDQILALKTESVDVEKLLESAVEKAIQDTSEVDIANQCKVIEKWEEARIAAIEEQKNRLSVAKRLESIADLKKALKEKETKLWFFDNEEQIELELESKLAKRPVVTSSKKKKSGTIDEDYVPPEVKKRVN